MDWIVLFALTLVVTIYTIIGAVIFTAVEGPYTTNIQDQNINITNEIKARYAHLPADDVDNIISEVTRVVWDRQLIPNDTVPSWNFWQSMFFVGTVVTTVGYGNLVPVTPGGQMICIVFALIGIPLNFAMLAGIGEKLNTISRTRINPHLSNVVKCKNFVCLVRMVLTFFFGWVVFIQLPALYISYLEGWSYVSATYFAFTTLSTIGFGDLSPALSHVSIFDEKRVLLSVWTWLGLAWLSTIINNFQDAFSSLTTSLSNKTHAEDENDDQSEVPRQKDGEGPFTRVQPLKM